MTGVIRWRLTDLETSDEVVLPLNPKEMSTPTFAREATYAWSPGGLQRGIDRGQATPTSWTWGGVILTKAHYDLLLAWAERGVILHVADHLGRTFEMVIEQYDPIERQPTKTRDWRADYTMTCLLLKEPA